MLPRQIKRNGLTRRQLVLTDEALRLMIAGYTREAGVRGLERLLAKLCRKAAKRIASGEARRMTVEPGNLEALLGPRRFKDDALSVRDEVGVVTGLAWTSVGGETMPVEVAVMDGSGKLELTGSLGDVMKESARTAVTCVRTRAGQWGIQSDFLQDKGYSYPCTGRSGAQGRPLRGRHHGDRHPVCFDGHPSQAGCGHDRRDHPAWAGAAHRRAEGKTMAAYCRGGAYGGDPEDNASDLAEVDPVVREHVRFVTAETLDTVLQTALTVLPTGALLPRGRRKTGDGAQLYACTVRDAFSRGGTGFGRIAAIGGRDHENRIRRI